MDEAVRNGNGPIRVVIAGAGPAGSSLAIRLARAGFGVTLLEREKFPRHKLCGEFISPECLQHFEALGVRQGMLAAGGATISKTIFYEPSGRGIQVPSQWFGTGSAALSLSRAEMDQRLLDHARETGTEVIEGAAVNKLIVEKGRVAAVSVRNENGGTWSVSGDIFVDATGRTKVLSKLIDRNIGNASSRSSTMSGLVGFKAHLKNASAAPGCCEIFSFEGGYGGLSPIENDLANHCFLVRSAIVRAMKGDADAIVREFVYKNKRARTALEGAERVAEWIAVSVDGFGLKDLVPAANLFAVGDSAAFIDPFTGSGILMALESSELFAGLLQKYSSNLPKLAAEYRAGFIRRFQTRLRVCSLLRRAAFTPTVAWLVIALLSPSERLRHALARSTRGTARLMSR